MILALVPSCFEFKFEVKQTSLANGMFWNYLYMHRHGDFADGLTMRVSIFYDIYIQSPLHNRTALLTVHFLPSTTVIIINLMAF